MAEPFRVRRCLGGEFCAATLFASRTVTVSPSATPTTRPVMVSAWQASVQQASASAAANGLIFKNRLIVMRLYTMGTAVLLLAAGNFP